MGKKIEIFSKPAKFFTKENFEAFLIETFNDTDVKNSIIEVIQERLRRKGVDYQNRKLKTDSAIEFKSDGFYSPFNIKNSKQNFVDLYETGDFYKSFKIFVQKNFFEIYADFVKENNKHIADNFSYTYKEEEFENSITGLNDNELQTLIEDEIIPLFIEKLLENIQKYIE